MIQGWRSCVFTECWPSTHTALRKVSVLARARNPHPWEEKQKDQKFKVVLGCVVNLRLAWATEVTVSKQN